VAGLVVVTPACGFIDTTGAIVIGIAAGLIPFFACYKLKHWLGYDDALDTFGVHAVGGTLGALLTGFLATPTVNSNLSTNLKNIVGSTLWIEQIKAIGITLALAVVGTTIIAYIVKAVVGLRVSEDVEFAGLDIAEHGEEGYHGAVTGGHSPGYAAKPSILSAVDEVIHATAKGKQAT
jgi:Amt family ammonium transporter